MYARSGRVVVMAQMSSPTPHWYESCMDVASCFWAALSKLPMAELNFLVQLGSEGSGVGRLVVVVKLFIQVERYFSKIFLMNVEVDILM